jgi:hypothetical protein
MPEEHPLLKILTSIDAHLAEIVKAMQSGPAPATHAGYSGPRSNDDPPDATTPRGEWCSFVFSGGKHPGKRMDQVPASYIQWFSRTLAKEGKLGGAALESAIRNWEECRASGKAPQGSSQQGPSVPMRSPTPPARSAPPRMPQNTPPIDDDVPF